MKKQIEMLFIGLIAIICSCNQTTDKKAKKAENSGKEDSIALTNPKKTESATSDPCIRGQAKPIILKTVYPNTHFFLQADSLTAYETVNFNNGDKLVIHNWGCEYFVLTFRFETSQYQHDTSNLEFWFKAATKLMAGIQSGIDAPIDIKKGLNFLDNYIEKDRTNNYKNLKLCEDIDFGETVIRDFVTLNRIEKLSEKLYAVTITFTTGPL